MPATKTPAHATFAGGRTPAPSAPLAVLATALVAVLAFALWTGAAVGQTADDAAIPDSTAVVHTSNSGTYVHAGLATSSLMGYDSGIGLTAAFGDYSVFDRFRGEVELSFASMASGSYCWSRQCERHGLRALSLTANAYYDYRNRTAWTPFVGVGVGVKSQAWSGSSGRGWREPAYSQLNGAFHANLGVAYAATEDLAVQLALRGLGWGAGPADQGWFQLGLRLNR